MEYKLKDGSIKKPKYVHNMIFSLSFNLYSIIIKVVLD